MSIQLNISMTEKISNSVKWVFSVASTGALLALLFVSMSASALTPLPTPEPKPGSYGLEATKKQPPPTQAATITTPGNGSSFAESPITVNGICQAGLLVQIYNNGVMVGAVMCENGSFSIQVSLFAGVNELSAIVYDDLYQAGPASAVVTVNYNDTNFTAFGELVTLTSIYGRRSAPAGDILTWPLQLSGGTGPYAFSIDWGDGTPSELKSTAFAGNIDISHSYKRAGIYRVSIRVTDANGVSAFLQLVAVASGQVTDTPAATDGEGVPPQPVAMIQWVPVLICLLLLPTTYWLGRRSMLVTLRNKMLRERDAYKQS